MQRKLAIVGLMLVMAAESLSRADSLDDAEAKRRGVPVEVVELEHAKATNAALQSELSKLREKVATLQRELAKAESSADVANKALAKLKADMTPEQQKMILQNQSREAAIAQAMKDKKIIVGMSIDDVKKVCGGQLVLKGQSAVDASYQANVDTPSGIVCYYLTVAGNSVTDLTVDRPRMTVGGGYNGAAVRAATP